MPLCVLLCGPKIRNKDLILLYPILKLVFARTLRTGIDFQKLSLFHRMKISFSPVHYHFHVDTRQSVYESLSLSVCVVRVYVFVCYTVPLCIPTGGKQQICFTQLTLAKPILALYKYNPKYIL